VPCALGKLKTAGLDIWFRVYRNVLTHW